MIQKGTCTANVLNSVPQTLYANMVQCGYIEGTTEMMKETRIWIDTDALDKVKHAFPETKRMTYTSVANWALRKLVETKKET